MQLKREKSKKFGEIELLMPSKKQEKALLDIVMKELVLNPEQKSLELSNKAMEEEILPMLTNIPMEIIDEETWEQPSEDFENMIVEIYIILTRIYTNHLKKQRLEILKNKADAESMNTIIEVTKDLPKETVDKINKELDSKVVDFKKKTESDEMIEKLKGLGYTDEAIKKLTGEG